MIQNKVPQQSRVFKEGLVLDNYESFPRSRKGAIWLVYALIVRPKDNFLACHLHREFPAWASPENH
jgi:hypothetical protein